MIYISILVIKQSWRKCDRSSNIQLTKSSPKGGNAKKEGGRAKKAENEASKKSQQAELAEAKESQKWSQGSKGKVSRLLCTGIFEANGISQGKKEDDAEKKAQQA